MKLSFLWGEKLGYDSLNGSKTDHLMTLIQKTRSHNEQEHGKLSIPLEDKENYGMRNCTETETMSKRKATASAGKSGLHDTRLPRGLCCLDQSFNIFYKTGCGTYTSCLLLFIRETRQTVERHQPCQSSMQRRIYWAQVRTQKEKRAEKEWCNVGSEVTTRSNWKVIWFFNSLTWENIGTFKLPTVSFYSTL
jgi:hypothetical protein